MEQQQEAFLTLFFVLFAFLSSYEKFNLVKWIFPYYMERFIQQEIPSITMSDYQVCYSSNGTSSYKDGLEIGKHGARKV